MKLTNYIRLIIIIFLSLSAQNYFASFELANTKDIYITNSYGEVQHGTRCATTDNLNLNLPRGPESLSAWRAENPKREKELIIPVAFHVITTFDGIGNVTDKQIEEQINILNDSYAAMQISFRLKSINRVKNSFFYYSAPGPQEFFMKLSLSDLAKNTLNIYTASPTGGILGYASLPWSYPESSFMHGVVVLNESLPGGKATDYNLGKTTVHEVGHYLGLYHTFQMGCSAPGDEVDDTPYHAEATYGCPKDTTLDTCSSPGLDPIHNYMNYSDDACMFEFTKGQEDRIDWAISNYKNGLL